MTLYARRLRLRLRLVLTASAFAVAVLTGSGAPAWADGDPGSDVLVYQSLFVGFDSGISIPAQVRLGDLLRSSASSGAPIRVAIIGHRDDLGSVTGLWRRPAAYAHFLGYELSLGYTGRLLVVMPNGLGVNWPHHTIQAAADALSKIATGPSGAQLTAAAEAGVVGLAAQSGVTLRPPVKGAAVGGPRPVRAGAAVPTITGFSTTPTPSHRPVFAPTGGATTDRDVGLVALIAIAGVAGAVLLRRGGWRPTAGAVRLAVRRWVGRSPEPHRASLAPRGVMACAAGGLIVGAALLATALFVLEPDQPSSAGMALADNPDLDPGTALSERPAPNFTLTDQSGHRVSLRSFRGKVTLLDFNDAECTTICPLTTTAMLDAKRMLGAAGRDVQLLGVNADPKATSIEDTISYTQLHGLVGRWRFLTGSLTQLKAVWHAYGIEASIQRGLISHTPALYLIDRQGRLRRLYLTQQSYAAVGQFGQVLAHEVSALLPAHPRVRSHLAYAPPQTISPRQSGSLAAAGGGRITLGPGRPRLYVFFDTWDREVTGLAGELDALNAYARHAGLPQLTGVDESVVEPSRRALPQFLKTLPAPLRYRVAVDQTGRVGDGYQVQGLPTLVLTSAAGKIVWYDAVNTSRWPTVATLEREVKTALAPADSPSMSTPAMLLGSPAPLAELHRQAGRVIGDGAQLEARIRTLRGYPIVLNAWASWCSPCKAEFSLFASASKQFGRQVAFLGVNTNDPSSAAAAAFLRAHPVSYPSYRDRTTGLRRLLPAGFEGLPTTIFLAPDGRITEVHTGQYDAQGSLDADIKRYALETG